jgi:hypothetical protein
VIVSQRREIGLRRKAVLEGKPGRKRAPEGKPRWVRQGGKEALEGK